MTFVGDENIDRQIVDRLRISGHSVLYVAELDPGISDEQVLEFSRERDAVLVTADKDFGELVFRQGRLFTGILLVRLLGLSPGEKADIVFATIKAHGSELPNAFTVVTKRGVRIRRLTS